jgi:hypothetical protein
MGKGKVNKMAEWAFGYLTALYRRRQLFSMGQKL